MAKLYNPSQAGIGKDKPFHVAQGVEYQIPSGASVSLPLEHALYLKKVYPFLQLSEDEVPSIPVKSVKEQVAAELKEEVSEGGEESPEKASCPHCDKEMSLRGLPMHIGRYHKEAA